MNELRKCIEACEELLRLIDKDCTPNRYDLGGEMYRSYVNTREEQLIYAKSICSILEQAETDNLNSTNK